MRRLYAIDEYLTGQNADLLHHLTGAELRPDLEIKEPREKERLAHMIHELLNLITLHGNKALVAAVLAVFRLKHNAGNAAGPPLLGGDALTGGSAWDRTDRLVVFCVGPGGSIQVREYRRSVHFLKECGGGESPEMVKGGGAERCCSANQHWVGCWGLGLRRVLRHKSESGERVVVSIPYF